MPDPEYMAVTSPALDAAGTGIAVSLDPALSTGASVPYFDSNDEVAAVDATDFVRATVAARAAVVDGAVVVLPDEVEVELELHAIREGTLTAAPARQSHRGRTQSIHHPWRRGTATPRRLAVHEVMGQSMTVGRVRVITRLWVIL
jgi:hypothetical protein